MVDAHYSDKLLMGIYFYPRGGSAHVCRALAREFERNGLRRHRSSPARAPISASTPLASSFYAGLDLRAVDFTPALRCADAAALRRRPGTAPIHGSYEDRPGAEDPVLACLDDEAFELQVEAWARRARARRRPPTPTSSTSTT